MGVATECAKATWLFWLTPSAVFGWTPARMPEKHLFSNPVLASIFQSTPLSTNSLIHKYYFHMVALVCARIIYIYWNCLALSGPEPNTRPGPTIEETQRNALPPACQEGGDSRRKHRQKED